MILSSISKIQKVFDTGQKPVLITCSNLEDYVCKHSYGYSPSKTLFIEWLAYHLMQKANIRFPEFALVNILENHTLTIADSQPLFFINTTCFATKFIEHAEEVNLLTLNTDDFKRVSNQEDLLKIAFFDLWLANEDRSHNNFNLLYYSKGKETFLVPIDHGSCLNTLCFDFERTLCQIEYGESLISTELFQIIQKGNIKNIQMAEEFLEKMYLCINELDQYFDEIIDNIPEDWKIPGDYVLSLKRNLFDENWLKETKVNFLSYCETSLNLR